MRQLIVRDIFAKVGIWVGALLVAAAAGAALSVAAGLVETGVGLPLLQALALDVLGSTVVVLTVVAAVVVLASTVRLTVALQRRGYALWQMVGITPYAVTTIVRTQLMLVALVGSVAGVAAAAPFVPSFLRFGLSDSEGLGALNPRFGLLSGLAVVVAVAVVVWLSARRATRRLARVRPIEALRDPDRTEARMTVGRWIVTIGTLAVATSMTWSLAGSDLSRSGSQVLLIGPLITSAAAAAGPTLFPIVLRAWTRLIPARVSSAWFLARNSAAYETTRSSATISALVVTIALPGSIYAGFFTFGNAIQAASGAETAGLPPQTFLLFLGGPLLLSLTGAVAVTAMANQSRERQSALVRAAGGTRAVVLLSAVGEAVIQVVTAFLVSALVVTATGVGEALALNTVAPGTRPALGLAASGAAAGVSLLLVLIATVVPTLIGSRRSVREVLAAD